jgi:hypothetical protein
VNAGLKWLELLLDILSLESSQPLLSEGADGIVEKHPVAGRLFIVCVGAIVTLHLANLIDERYDLLATSFWKRAKS